MIACPRCEQSRSIEIARDALDRELFSGVQGFELVSDRFFRAR